MASENSQINPIHKGFADLRESHVMTSALMRLVTEVRHTTLEHGIHQLAVQVMSHATQNDRTLYERKSYRSLSTLSIALYSIEYINNHGKRDVHL